MARADSIGKMVLTMKAISLMVTSKVLADITLQIWINFTRENFVAVTWREEGLRLGQMVADMKEISKMVKRMERVLSSGLMGLDILAAGSLGNNMGLELFIIQKITQSVKENGKMVKESVGYQDQSNFNNHPLQTKDSPN